MMKPVVLSRHSIIILTVTAVALLSSTAMQAAELITNGSFENTSGTYMANENGFEVLSKNATDIPGWTVTANQVSWIPNGNPLTLMTPTGAFFLDLTGDFDDANFGGVTQTISTTPSQTYTLSLNLGADESLSQYAGSKSVSVTAGSSSTSFLFVPTGTGNQWGTFSFNFVATGLSTVITISGTGSGTGNEYLGLDDVSVVPEPSDYLLILIGALGCLFLRIHQILRSGRRFLCVAPTSPLGPSEVQS